MKLWQGNDFTPVCGSVHWGVSAQGVLCQGSLSGGLCPEGSLSKGVSVQGSLCSGFFVQGRESLPRGGVSLSRGSLSRGSVSGRPPV